MYDFPFCRDEFLTLSWDLFKSAFFFPFCDFIFFLFQVKWEITYWKEVKIWQKLRQKWKIETGIYPIKYKTYVRTWHEMKLENKFFLKSDLVFYFVCILLFWYEYYNLNANNLSLWYSTLSYACNSVDSRNKRAPCRYFQKQRAI